MRLWRDLKICQNIVINVVIEERAKKNAKGFRVERQFNKQIEFLKINPRYPSLHYQPLEGGLGLWRFRVTKKYWGVTLKREQNIIQIVNVILHP